jgi:O-antigen/teichoic acid export membrane protein
LAKYEPTSSLPPEGIGARPPPGPGPVDDEARVPRLLRGAAYSLASLVLATVFLFVLHVLMARALGADVLGAYSIAVGVMSVTVAIGLLGLETGMLKALPPESDQPGGPGVLRPLVGVVLLVVAVTTALLGIALTLGAPWLVRLFDVARFETFFSFVFLALPLLALNTLGLAILRALSWFPTEAAINGFLSRGLRPVALAALLWWGLAEGDPSRILLIMVFSSEGLTAAVLLSVLLFRLRPSIPFSLRSTAARLRTTLQFSLPVMPAMAIQAGLQHADLIVVGIVASAAETGIYRAAALVALTLTLIMRAFGAAFAPMISADHAANRTESLRRTYRDVALLIFSASLPAFFLFSVNRVGLMVLFGPEFVAFGATVLVILAAGQLVNALTGQVGYMLLLTGSRNAYVWTAFLAVVSMVACTGIGYASWGILGAATGSAVATAGINLVRVALVYRHLRVHPFSSRQLLLGTGVAAITALTIGIEGWVAPPAWVTLLASLVVASPFVIAYVSRIWKALKQPGQQP